jgi:hypothetical protein
LEAAAVAVLLGVALVVVVAILDVALEALLAVLSDIYIVFDLKSLNTYLQYLLIVTKTIKQ